MTQLKVGDLARVVIAGARILAVETFHNEYLLQLPHWQRLILTGHEPTVSITSMTSGSSASPSRTPGGAVRGSTAARPTLLEEQRGPGTPTPSRGDDWPGGPS